MVFLALAIIIIIVPLSLLFRHKPEQYGLLPDGKTEDNSIHNNDSKLTSHLKQKHTVKKALRSRAFWYITLASSCHTMVVMGVITHIMPYLSSINLDRSLSGIVASAIPVISIGGRLCFGWLGDRQGRIKIAALAFGMMSCGAFLLGLTSMTVTGLLILFIIFFGIGYGGIIALRPSLLREYFGRSNFGTIFGIVLGINLIGSLTGPPLAGWVFDEFGSYEYIWYAFAAVMIAAVFFITAINRSQGNESAAD